jgi:hypothetical protein
MGGTWVIIVTWEEVREDRMEAVDMSEAELCDFREGEELEMSVDSSDTAELYASSLGAGGGSDIGRGSNGVHVQGGA